MPDEDVPREDELEHRQGDLYPVGRALRQTFDADNHDSLGTDLTGLMLALARIDPEATPPSAPQIVAPPAPPTAAPAVAWWRAAMGRLLR